MVNSTPLVPSWQVTKTHFSQVDSFALKMRFTRFRNLFRSCTCMQKALVPTQMPSLFEQKSEPGVFSHVGNLYNRYRRRQCQNEIMQRQTTRNRQIRVDPCDSWRQIAGIHAGLEILISDVSICCKICRWVCNADFACRLCLPLSTSLSKL